ncbi:MAG: hypothetical protein Q8R04_01750, partial [Nanoarchaeota archaeon]|nr:hypothetical protein [Nanoarchaeota archaeon]
MNKRLFIFMLLYISILAGRAISQSEIPDYICTQNLSITQSPLANLVKEPLPYFIPYQNATCFRVGCAPDEFPLMPYNIGNDSEKIGTILYTKYGDNKQNHNFSYNITTQMVKQNNITILEKIDFCYILNN